MITCQQVMSSICLCVFKGFGSSSLLHLHSKTLPRTNGDLCTYSRSMPQMYPKNSGDQSQEVLSACHKLGLGVPHAGNNLDERLFCPVSHVYDQGTRLTFL